MFNVTRSPIAPSSLSKKTSYDEQDVYDELYKCFNEKCYLCESKGFTSVNVEHFDPHEGNESKKYDWNNLYLVCGRCNNIKLAKYKNLLDCCDPSVDVSMAIKLLPPRSYYGEDVHVEAMGNDIKTRNTAALLNDIYNNDKTVNKKITAKSLRNKIFTHLYLLNDHIRKYFSEDSTEIEKTESIEKMKVLISPQAPYSAFARWIILNDTVLGPMLSSYMI